MEKTSATPQHTRAPDPSLCDFKSAPPDGKPHRASPFAYHERLNFALRALCNFQRARTRATGSKVQRQEETIPASKPPVKVRRGVFGKLPPSGERRRLADLFRARLLRDSLPARRSPGALFEPQGVSTPHPKRGLVFVGGRTSQEIARHAFFRSRHALGASNYLRDS